MSSAGGKSDPNLYIQLEFLVIGDGFSYLFLFSYETIKILAVKFGWPLPMPGEQIWILTTWAYLGNSLPSLQRKSLSVFTVTTWPRGLTAGAQRLRALPWGARKSEESGLEVQAQVGCSLAVRIQGNHHICIHGDDLIGKRIGPLPLRLFSSSEVCEI